MSGSDRRTVLGAAAAAMAWPLLSAVPARAAPLGHNFAPPASRMLYSRKLTRELPGGAAFVVERRFAIRFDPQAHGFVVSGEQVGVEVAAPPSLERFAQIEKERLEASLFPLALDGQGQISGARPGRDRELLETAISEARARLSQASLSPGDRAETEAYIRAVHQTASGLISELPSDLFSPVEPDRSPSREVSLPGGGSGRILSRFQASTDPATGLMREALREVVSDLAGDRRRIVESWKLAPLA